MQDVVFVENLEGLEKFALPWEKALQSAPITVFVDEVEIIGGFEHIEVTNDMLIDFDVGENVDFIDSAFL